MDNPTGNNDISPLPFDASAAIVRRSVRLWAAVGAIGFVGSLVFGCLFTSCSSNVLGSVLVSTAILATSVYFARGWSGMVVEGKRGALIGFAMGITCHLPVTVGGYIVVGQAYQEAITQQMCGASVFVGYIFIAGTCWGSLVAHWRNQALRNLPAPSATPSS